LTRKSPFKHPVKQHLRKGRVVHHYERGEGKAPRVVIGSPRSVGASYRVNINYADAEAFDPEGKKYPVSHGAKTEHLTVKARSYLDAMDQGLTRIGSGVPLSVMMRRL
jgi:hypothetical protein